MSEMRPERDAAVSRPLSIAAPSPPIDPDLVSLVIPVLDEVDNLGPLVAGIKEALDGAAITFECILVNDGSTDGSAPLLDRIHEDDPRFKVIHFVRTYGQTAALSAGIRHTRGAVVVMLDADLQNDPADIPAMLERLGHDADIVCGWRAERKDRFWDRRLPSLLANRLISWISKVRLNDYGCTLKACRREFLTEIPLYGQMHRFIPIYAHWAGARVAEMEVRHHPRRAGRSKYGLGRIFRVALDLLTVKFLRDFASNPIYFFGYFGFASIFAGVACASYALYEKLFLGVWMHKNPLIIISSMCILLGFNALFFGLLAEILIRMSFRLRGREPYKIRSRRGDLEGG